MNIKNLLKKPFRPLLNWLRRDYAAHVNEASRAHEPYIQYLYYEISELRSLVRKLTADRPNLLHQRAQTMGSFEDQWRELNQGRWMFSNPEFRAQLPEIVCKFTARDPSWFPGKRVLDAGCGSGRFSYALCKLGAEVIAVDQSASGLAKAKEAIESEGLGDKVKFVQANLLEPLALQPDFDLVWCFGVLHHTGDTFRGFRNIAPLVKSGGFLFLMIYGEPRLGHIDDFEIRVEYARLRAMAHNKSFEEIIEIIKREKPGKDLHGWFDAISPAINDCYQPWEIEGWLLKAGFTDIKRTEEMANHHLVARRKAGSE